ncbi:cobalamin binding intrinsic factor-like [Ptychodera flava]|uniref:cobalamin binding intrinsic factor-like n=1 Tax=Ptychodera flava TaxID=63121 RepID=UPI00396A3577
MTDCRLLILAFATVSCVVAGNTDKVCGPDTTAATESAAREAYNKAVEWLKSQQTDQWGWENTPSVLLSLQLTNPEWFNREDLESQLNVKQLEIELLAAISKRKNVYYTKITESEEEDASMSDELSPGQLAYYMLALHATCHNVTDFYGHNLTHLLEHGMKKLRIKDVNNYFAYSLGVLALCNTKSKIERIHIRVLHKGQEDDGGYPHGRDSTAMVVMAMTCLSQLPEFTDDVMVRLTLRKGIRNLLSCQETDGGFGNIHTSALAAQAFSAVHEMLPATWHCEDLIMDIVSDQEESGSYGDHLMTTMQVLPSLVGRHYGNIDTSRCHKKPEVEQSHGEDFIDLSAFKKTISVSLTVVYKNGSNDSFSVSTQEEQSLYDIMLALSQETNVTFDMPDSAWGRYLLAINEVSADSGKFYWRLYNKEEPLSVGIEDYLPEDGDHVYFKYTPVTHSDYP